MIMHVDEAIGIDRLMYAFERAQDKARREKRPILASITMPIPFLDPLAVYSAAAASIERSLWSQPSRRFALVGLGVAQGIEAGDLERFESTRQARRALLESAIVESSEVDSCGTGPVLLGAFSFDPQRASTAEWNGFPAARLILPRLLFTSNGDDHSLTLNAVVWPDSDASAEARRLIDERDRAAGIRALRLVADDFWRRCQLERNSTGRRMAAGGGRCLDIHSRRTGREDRAGARSSTPVRYAVRRAFGAQAAGRSVSNVLRLRLRTRRQDLPGRHSRAIGARRGRRSGGGLPGWVRAARSDCGRRPRSGSRRCCPAPRIGKSTPSWCGRCVKVWTICASS